MLGYFDFLMILLFIGLSGLIVYAFTMGILIREKTKSKVPANPGRFLKRRKKQAKIESQKEARTRSTNLSNKDDLDFPSIVEVEEKGEEKKP